jgi:hypothetical protein
MAASAPSRGIILCGTEQTEPPSRVLTAGPLSVELDNGALRYVRLNDVEVLRAIAFLVRDENWGTFSPTISDLRIAEGRDGFSVSYNAVCADAKRRLRYAATIAGKADGSLRFEATATPETDVLTNRTGFIVLHPLNGVAGHTVKVEHVDGRQVTDKFPAIVNPVQPFYDIRALSHEVTPGLWATCRMEGDSFEMEDHRNWTDASYKTYVRPLALPWPYTLPKGETFVQSVTLSFSGPLPAVATGGAATDIAVAVGAPSGSIMPRLGLGVPAEEAEHALAAADLVKQLGPTWLVCHLDLRQGHGAKEIAAYKALSQKTGAEVALEIVIPGVGAPADELAPAAAAVTAAGLRPAAVAVSPAADLKAVLPGSKGPDVPPAEKIYAASRAAFPGIKLGGGMFSFFTELNRKRPPAELLDYVTHTTCPIVHAADDRSVMETLEALSYAIQSTRAFIGKTPYRVGPSAIGCRDNPYGKATAANPDNGRVCLTRTDPRQRGLFGAAWTLAYIAAFARGGIEALAMGAPTGPFGVIYRRTEDKQPYFDGLGGKAVYPAYHVLAGLAVSAGAEVLDAMPSRQGVVQALALRSGGKTTLWLANLTAEEQAVKLSGLPAGSARLALLDAASFGAATTDPGAFAATGGTIDGAAPLRLGAYAVARLEFAGR